MVPYAIHVRRRPLDYRWNLHASIFLREVVDHCNQISNIRMESFCLIVNVVEY